MTSGTGSDEPLQELRFAVKPLPAVAWFLALYVLCLLVRGVASVVTDLAFGGSVQLDAPTILSRLIGPALVGGLATAVIWVSDRRTVLVLHPDFVTTVSGGRAAAPMPWSQLGEFRLGRHNTWFARRFAITAYAPWTRPPGGAPGRRTFSVPVRVDNASRSQTVELLNLYRTRATQAGVPVSS